MFVCEFISRTYLQFAVVTVYGNDEIRSACDDAHNRVEEKVGGVGHKAEMERGHGGFRLNHHRLSEVDHL